MASSVITFAGLREAEVYLSRLKSGAEAVGRLSFVVGNSVRYARFVHEGTRRMRGRPYLADAAQVELRTFGDEILHAVEQGPRAVADTGQRAAYRVQRRAQQGAPVKTGNLRRDIHTVMGRRG